MKKAMILIVVGAMVLIWMASCYEPAGMPVKVIIPNNYEGLVFLIQSVNGDAPEIESGKYVYRVLPSGIAYVRNLDPLYSWHNEEMEYANGKDIPEAFASRSDSASFRLLTSLSDDGKEHRYIVIFYVGENSKGRMIYNGNIDPLLKRLEDIESKSGDNMAN